MVTVDRRKVKALQNYLFSVFLYSLGNPKCINRRPPKKKKKNQPKADLASCFTCYWAREVRLLYQTPCWWSCSSSLPHFSSARPPSNHLLGEWNTAPQLWTPLFNPPHRSRFAMQQLDVSSCPSLCHFPAAAKAQRSMSKGISQLAKRRWYWFHFQWRGSATLHQKQLRLFTIQDETIHCTSTACSTTLLSGKVSERCVTVGSHRYAGSLFIYLFILT